MFSTWDALLRCVDVPELALLFDRPAWMRDALCREYPEVEFFIGQGGDPDPAKAVCARCVVADECRAYALEHGEEFGILGRRRCERAPAAAR